MNFDPRRQAGNQVLLFSCGGRADGGGQVTNSQLFAFNGGSGPLPLVPQNGNNQVCLSIKNGALDQSNCNAASPAADQLFTIGAGSSNNNNNNGNKNNGKGSNSSKGSTSKQKGHKKSNKGSKKPKKGSNKGSNNNNASKTSSAAAASNTNNAVASTGTGLPPGTQQINQQATAEAQQRDDTATRAFSGVPIQAPNGECLFVDAQTGDFRENLIPIQTRKCDGSAAQQWDVITSGKHNNVKGAALFVSTLTQGCMNFDPRRAAGNQVLLFSCGGRADGGGDVTNSQLFNFNGGSGPLALVPQNANNQTCLDINGQGLLDQSACNAASPSSSQLFTIGN